MSLRVRLALAIVLTAIPLWLGITWIVHDLEDGRIVDNLREQVIERMESHGRERCEDRPERFGGPGLPGEPRPSRAAPRGRPAQNGRGRRDPNPRRRYGRPSRPFHSFTWAYDTEFRAANPDAPALPDSLRGRIAAGADAASEWTSETGRNGRQLSMALRMPWWDEGGPCALVWVQHRVPIPSFGLLSTHWSALAMLGIALLAGSWAVGPVVRRVLRLTDEVRHAAEHHYRHPVTVRGRDEIGRLAHAFNEAGTEIRAHLQSLEQREETLRSFIGNTTHDVMLPLTVLQGHLTTLRKQTDNGVPPDRDTLTSALDETQYVVSILHNLGARAKLEAGDTHIRRDPVDLGALLERTVSRHRTLASARSIELNCAVPEQPLEMLGDVTLLEQAVSNVIHNAVRYNHTGGHVAAVLEPLGDDRFLLRVVDDGPGIAASELSRLTERRYRGAEARTRHPDGHGLGLHIAHDVADRHGCVLRFGESEYGGLCVELEGPLSGDATDRAGGDVA